MSTVLNGSALYEKKLNSTKKFQGPVSIHIAPY